MTKNKFGYRIPKVQRRDVVTSAKFLIAGCVTAAAFIVLTDAVWDWGWNMAEYVAMFGILAVSTLGALPAHFRAPESYQDRFHKFGVLFLMLIPINVLASVGFIGLLILMDGWYGNTSIAEQVWALSVMFAGSSVLLPAPYSGALIGARWVSND